MTQQDSVVKRDAPRLLRAFMVYILPALVLSVVGIVISINHTIGNAIETYQANLDTVVATEAFQRLSSHDINEGRNTVDLAVLDKPTRDLLKEEEIKCVAVLRPDGSLLDLYRFDDRCQSPPADAISEMMETGRPSIIEGGMLADDWTSIVLIKGKAGTSGHIVALSRRADIREGSITYIARDWTLVFAGLFAAATTGLVLLVIRAQRVLDRSFSELSAIETRLEQFVSRSALAYARGNDGKAKRFSATVLFADLSKFSSFAETSSPEATAELIDEFVSIGTRAIESHSGDVDKLLGDGLLAWFEGADSITNALDAICEFSEGCAELDRRPSFGLMHGEIVAVSLGQGARRDFTILGRTVNLASRLCSVASEGEVVMPAAVFAASSLKAEVLERSTMTFKNHEQALDVVRIHSRAPAQTMQTS